jgi:uncharacterized membrane protein
MKKTETLGQIQYSTFLIYLTLFMLLAFALRLYGINARSLWFDEAIEYWMASVPIKEIHQAVANATHDPPLYSYFLHFWMSLGFNEFFLRIPSLYASMLSIAGIALLSRRLFNRTTAIIAVILLGVSAADIRYAQETGQYSLMVCLNTFNLLFLYQAHKKNSWHSWTIWGFSSLLSIYTHYGSTIIILATASTFLFYNIWQRNWEAAKKHIITGIITVSLVLPLMIFVVPFQLDRLGATRHPIDLKQFLSISSQIITFHWLGNQQILFGWPWPQIPAWIGWLPALIVIIVALAKSKSIISPSVVLIISLLIYYGISRTGSYFFIGTRHSLLITPIFILATASGITIVGKKYKLLSILLISPLVLMSLLVPREPQENLRSVFQYWQAHKQFEDATFIYYGAAPGFQYQLDVSSNAISNLPRRWYGDCWFRDFEASYCRDNNIYYGRWTRAKPAEESKDLLFATIGSSPERIWLVFSHAQPTDHEDLVNALSPQYELVSENIYRGASLALIQKQ